MWHEFSEKNPFRAPDWRWLRSGLAVDGRLPPSRRRDDGWTRRAIRFRRVLGSGDSGTVLDYLADHDPDLFYAYWVWKNRDDPYDRDPRRATAHAIEARVLGRQDDVTIAARCHLDVGSVAAYRAVFFDVESRMSGPDYVMQHVVGPTVYSGLRARNFELIWKLLAYHGGPVVIDWLLAVLRSVPTPRNAEDLPGYLDTVFGDVIRQKATVTALTFNPADETLAPEILKAYQNLVEMERSATGSAKGQLSFVTDSVRAMLGSFQIRVGGLPPADGNMEFRAHTLERSDLASAIELRGDELASLALGGPVLESTESAFETVREESRS
jgi:hypothetical protein